MAGQPSEHFLWAVCGDQHLGGLGECNPLPGIGPEGLRLAAAVRLARPLAASGSRLRAGARRAPR